MLTDSARLGQPPAQVAERTVPPPIKRMQAEQETDGPRDERPRDKEQESVKLYYDSGRVIGSDEARRRSRPNRYRAPLADWNRVSISSGPTTRLNKWANLHNDPLARSRRRANEGRNGRANLSAAVSRGAWLDGGRPPAAGGAEVAPSPLESPPGGLSRGPERAPGRRAPPTAADISD
jgi:hypothetical protein